MGVIQQRLELLQLLHFSLGHQRFGGCEAPNPGFLGQDFFDEVSGWVRYILAAPTLSHLS